MATVVNDARAHDVTITRFLTESGASPEYPSPAWLLVADGKTHSTYRTRLLLVVGVVAFIGAFLGVLFALVVMG